MSAYLLAIKSHTNKKTPVEPRVWCGCK